VSKAIAQVARHPNVEWAGIVLNGTEIMVDKENSNKIITVPTETSKMI
jgi:hypothetical protein